MVFNIRDEFLQIPPITRIYTTACVLTTVAVQLDMVSPYTLYFNPKLIIENYQLWRLVTNFTFFGTIGFNFLLNIIFIYRHCRWLEEHSFRNRTADFVVMFIFGGSLMTILAFFIHLVFLGHALTMMLVYVWSRRNHFIRMNIFGVLNFRAPYLPWVLLGFSVLLGNPLVIDLMGIGVGHVYYFLVDVFPRKPGGFKILKTPSILKYLLDPPAVDPNYERMPEDRPGGFDWGLGENVPPPNDDDDNRGENNEGEQ